MKSIKYLLRLDDACPTMNKEKWDTIELILDRYKIRPMVGIIPNNKDSALEYNQDDDNFVEKTKEWQNKKWVLAMHGYDHVYCSNNSGINPIHKRSEFAGLKLEIQKEKIRNGIRYFNEYNIQVNYFFAPSHTFDLNTIAALKSESNINIISDTIAFNPYKRFGIVFIPQQFGSFKAINIPGTWTFCCHPNTMNNNSISSLNNFMENNNARFVSFDELNLNNIKNITLKDLLYQYVYFAYRKIRNKK